MAFGINAHHLPHISTFAAAEALWLKTPDYSKKAGEWGANERPLKDRRSHHFRLVRALDIEGKTMYQAYLYATPMVTYYQDGRVTIRQGTSQSSAKFVDRISPFGAFLYQGWMWVKVGRQDVWGKDGEYYTPDGELTIFPAGTQTMVTGAKQMYKQVVNREVTQPVRKALKDFVDYWKVRETMGGVVIRRAYFGNHNEREEVVHALLATPGDKDLWNKAYTEFGTLEEFWGLVYALLPDARRAVLIPLGRLP